MLLIAVLVAALACVVVGVVLSSVAVLIASLALSVLAAGLLFRLVRASRGRGQPSPAESGEPAFPTSGASAEPAAAAGPDSAGPEVRVIDGRPDYHRPECERIAGSADSEPIPLGQALEDGFAPCEQCRPPTELPTEDAPKPATGEVPRPAGSDEAANAAVRTVWVADGYPEYHVPDCGELSGLEAEPVPYEQAVEDGFQPCVVCNPDTLFAADAGSAPTPFAPRAEPAQQAAEVWVADGYPAYHRHECTELAGLDAEPVPHEQAIEDGFAACEICRPDSAQVWVADGYPNYHRDDCAELTGLDAEPVPHEQAVEDGFAPCTVCRPDDDAAGPAEVAETPQATEATEATEPAEPAGETGTGGETEVAGESETFSPPAAEPAAAGPRQVWVADGFPDYHRAGCPTLVGLDDEPIPRDQAVEDGFTPCAECRPDEPATPVAPTPAAGATSEPAETTPEPAEAAPVPSDTMPEPAETTPEASDTAPEPSVAGAPSPHPEPAEESAAASSAASASAPAAVSVLNAQSAAAPAAAAEPSSDSAADPAVWVVDGRPRYHAQDCLLIKGQEAQPVPERQAAEDGFLPCSLCRPAASG